jgi:hypothetical protein
MALATETLLSPASIPYEAEGHIEQRKSFDALASVRMFRYDLENFGQVLPETRERVQDEELSLIAEGMNRVARTTFALQRQGDDLMYFAEGQWKSYTGMLLTGEQVAKAEAEADPRKQFLAEDAVTDLYHLYQMRRLQPGEQHVWSSPYRYDVEQRYGRQFMQACGRFPERQMGFIYRAHCAENGTVVLESQTVDRSYEPAFAAVLERSATDGKVDMDDLVAVYDDVLAQRDGGEFYAGRRGAERFENVWETLLQQRDLIEYFLAKLEAIAHQPLDGAALEVAAKRHVYGVWAAFKRRINGEVSATEYRPEARSITGLAWLEQEVRQAFAQFAAAGQVMVGCGGAIAMLRGEEDILSADGSDVFDAIFGTREDKYGSLSFRCSKGHHNIRPFGKLIERCQTCQVSVRC